MEEERKIFLGLREKIGLLLVCMLRKEEKQGLSPFSPGFSREGAEPF